MEMKSLVGRLIDRVKWKLDRKRRWVADLRREAMAREEEAAKREAALRSEVQASAEQIAALKARLSDLETVTGPVTQPLEGTIQERLATLRNRSFEFEDTVRVRLEAGHLVTGKLRSIIDDHDHEFARLEQVISSTLAPRIPARADFGGQDEDAPEVSIIMPVFNRRRFVGTAIDSVRAQDFSSWELIVVDDGSSDDTGSVSRRYADNSRICWSRQPRLGSAAARNAGLRRAKGQLIAYLDSDNVWYPGYLSGMVAALRDNPQTDVAYGVLVTEAHGLGDRRLLFRPFDREQLLSGNFIDMNVLVHRARLVAELGGFDESLDRLIDWDLVLRYSATRPALGVPILGAKYQILDDQKVTDVALVAPNEVAIRKKWYPPQALGTAIRVLYVVWHYPQLSETYIESEIKQLSKWGVHIEVWREEGVAAPYPPSVPVHSGPLEDAVREAAPDLIHVHWLGFAHARSAALDALGLPVTVRLHSFDTTREGLEELLRKPWANTIYAFPAQAALLGRPEPRVLVVPVAFDTARFRPCRNKERQRVVRAGTALPSKDVPFAFELAKRLPDFHFVYAGVVAKNAESYVDDLTAQRERMRSPVEFQMNVPHHEIADLIGRAGIYLHTSNPKGAPHATPLGMPVSIAEAMATGAFVVYRQSTEFDAYVGDAGCAYRTLDEAAAIISETKRWTDEDWKGVQDRAIERAFRFHADEMVYRTILEDWVRIAEAQRRIKAPQTNAIVAKPAA